MELHLMLQDVEADRAALLHAVCFQGDTFTPKGQDAFEFVGDTQLSSENWQGHK